MTMELSCEATLDVLVTDLTSLRMLVGPNHIKTHRSNAAASAFAASNQIGPR